MGIIQNTLEQGLIYAIMALGVLITYSILDFPDLSVDGTFPLGAAVSALMITRGQSPALALLCAMAAGALAGGLTDLFPAWLEPYSVLLISLLLVILVKVLLDLFLKTRAGYLLRAVGDNETVVTSLARDKGSVKIMGLMISGALVALSGAVLCQQQHTFEVSMGTGAIAMALASVIIGTNLFRRVPFVKSTTAVIIGAIVYKACVAVAIRAGVPASDMKLITALLFLIILALGGLEKRRVKKHA